MQTPAKDGISRGVGSQETSKQDQMYLTRQVPETPHQSRNSQLAAEEGLDRGVIDNREKLLETSKQKVESCRREIEKLYKSLLSNASPRNGSLEAEHNRHLQMLQQRLSHTIETEAAIEQQLQQIRA